MSVSINTEVAGGAGSGTTTTTEINSGGGGSDRTAVTYEVDPVNGGYRVLTETVDGIPWTLSYDAQGRVIGREWAAGGLEAIINYDAQGFGYGDDTTNIFIKGGAIQVFSAQMTTLKAALITLGTEVSATFHVVDFDSGRGITLEWNAAAPGFRGQGGVEICVVSDKTAETPYGPGPGTSATRFTYTVPAWLLHPKTDLFFEIHIVAVGTASTKSVQFRINGTSIAQPSLSAGNQNQTLFWSTFSIDSLNVQRSAGSGRYSGSSSSGAASAFDFAADLTCTVVYILGGADTMEGVHRYLSIRNP